MTKATMGHIEQLLTPLRNTIVDKPPFASGSLQLPASHLSLLQGHQRQSRSRVRERQLIVLES